MTQFPSIVSALRRRAAAILSGISIWSEQRGTESSDDGGIPQFLPRYTNIWRLAWNGSNAAILH